MAVKRPITLDKRRCGNTTRLVDYYIQALFEREIITIIDHYGSLDIHKYHKGIFNKVVNRINTEHKNIIKKININSKGLTISWL